MSNVVRIEPLGRAREEASGVHGRAMIERRQRELIAIYKNRRARIAATRWAWCVRMVAVGAICMTAGHVATLRFAEPSLQVAEREVKKPAEIPAPAGGAKGSVPVQQAPTATPRAPQQAVGPPRVGTAPARETPKSVAVNRVPAMPTGRPGQATAAQRGPAAEEVHPPAPKNPNAPEQHQAAQRGTGVYEAPQHSPAVQKAPSFKVIEIPADGVALIQQGSVIKPVRVGERLPDNTVLKSAVSDAAGVETSNGRIPIDRKPSE